MTAALAEVDILPYSLQTVSPGTPPAMNSVLTLQWHTLTSACICQSGDAFMSDMLW